MKTVRDIIQEEIDNLMNSKLAKKTDAQLIHNEKLASWRNSEKNKQQFKQRGTHSAKLSFEVAKVIRDRFYFKNEMISDLAEEYKMAERNIAECLKNESYVVDTWEYPDYNEQREKNMYIRDRIDEKLQFIKDGYGVENFRSYFDCSNTVYYGLIKKYKLSTPKRPGCKRAKDLEISK